MKKLIISLLILIAFPLASQAETVHIDQKLSEQISIRADFTLPHVQEVQVLHAEMLQLNTEEYSLKMADRFFDETDSIMHDDFGSQDELFSYTGEFGRSKSVVSSKQGSFSYMDYALLQNGYNDPATYLLDKLYIAKFFPDFAVYTEEDVTYSHDNFPALEAQTIAKDTLSYIHNNDDYDFYPIYQYALSAEESQKIAFANSYKYTDFDSDDNMYLFRFGLMLNDIPVVSAENVVFHSETDIAPSHLYTDVYMSLREGIYMLNTRVLRISETGSSKPILTPEQIIDAIDAHFDSLIPANEWKFTEAYLGYFPVRSASNQQMLEFIPVWCFSATLVEDEVEYPDNRTFCFNAITGELVR